MRRGVVQVEPRMVAESSLQKGGALPMAVLVNACTQHFPGRHLKRRGGSKIGPAHIDEFPIEIRLRGGLEHLHPVTLQTPHRPPWQSTHPGRPPAPQQPVPTQTRPNPRFTAYFGDAPPGSGCPVRTRRTGGAPPAQRPTGKASRHARAGANWRDLAPRSGSYSPLSGGFSLHAQLYPLDWHDAQHVCYCAWLPPIT